MDLTERKKQILKRVVEDYIAAAEPVGSKALAEEMGGSVSSATIRNELADLVEMGYLEQPHTSAGRVPSPKGYRLYVNELMEKREVSETEAEEINEQLKSKLSGTDSVIAKAGQMVSSIVNYPVYSVTGGRREASVKRFELIAVDEMSFIVVVMGEDNRVKSQLQRSDLPFDSQRLADVKELLNTHFTGRSADEMSARLMSLSEQLSPELFLVVSKAVEYAIGVLEQSAQRNVETAGASQILKMPEYRDVDKAHDLVTFLVDNKEELPVPDDGAPLKILIGPENVNEALKETSVVVASYDIGDGMRGLVGVVGPTRMDYATVTARLSYFADSLTRMFGKNELPPREEDKEQEMGKKDKQNAAESTPEKNTAQQPTADEAAKTAETAKADETAEKSAEPETFTVTREQMEKMEGLAKSLADEQDKYLRLAAEYDNYRKRTAKEKESLYADAKIDTIKALLGVYDNLERGLAQYGDEESPHRKGLEMVFNQFKESLKKLGVETMDAAGKPFDPEKHNAVMHVEDENYGENTVVEVLQQGFTLGDKVLRFAIVKVAN